VDAIPNLGENQQIVFTEWPGRSPQDVENQVTYPLASALMGVPVPEAIKKALEMFRKKSETDDTNN
jgi:Cu(I)/Ag(I) efflux system membrane protein CusA/SilA